jgi:uncharacterized membrane protein
MDEGALEDSTGGAGDRWPVDLLAVAGLVVLANVVVLTPVVNDSPIRVVVGLVMVLVLPGYAVVAALFPEAPGPNDGVASDVADDEGGGTIDGIERAALSVALSIPVVALVGLALSLTPAGVRLESVLPAITVLTLGATWVAARRRAALAPHRRFRVPYREWLAIPRRAFIAPERRADRVLNVVLALSILLAMGAVTYAVAAPNEGEAFSALYLLSENDTGDLVADDYPTNFTVGETRPLTVGIENHEHESVNYTVVGLLERVRVNGTEATVLESARIDRFSVRLADNNTYRSTRSVRPTITGERVRLAYLLYREQPPEDPGMANAYRSVDLWIDVAE